MKITFRTKLILICSSFILLTVITISLVNYHYMKELFKINEQLEEISKSYEATNALNSSVKSLIMTSVNYLMGGDKGAPKEFDKLFGIASKNLKSCEAAVCHGAPKHPRDMVKTIQPRVLYIKDLSYEIFGLDRPVGNSRGILLMNDMTEISQELNEDMRDMLNTLEERVYLLRKKSGKIKERSPYFILGFTLAVIGLSIIIAYYIAWRFTIPIRKLLSGTQRVAQYDLEQEIEVMTKDEVGELTISFNSMTRKLKGYKKKEEEYSQRLEAEIERKTEELRQKEAHLIQSEKLASIGLLASGVAHELSNPLTSLMMNVNLLMESLDTESESYRELKKMDEDAWRCKEIIDNLLDFSRQKDLNLSHYDINDLIETTLDLLKNRFFLDEVMVYKNLGKDLPMMLCDEAQIKQVLLNIILNALQAMDGKKELTIATQLNGDRNEVEILIKDTGSGIPKDLRNKIFDPFFTTKSNGTGLGLSISYGIIQKHRGIIQVESATREDLDSYKADKRLGTTVTIRLPL